ncbi:MAG: phage tail length tape measure family protein [Gammaproteobacteria bacterium]
MGSRSLGSLTVDLVAKIGGFTAGLDAAARAAEDRSRKIERTLKRTGQVVGAAFAAIGVGALVKDIIAASIEQEDVLRQLEQRILSTGGAAGKTSTELADMASSLQKVTVYGDEAIVQMQGLLLSFTNIKGDIFDRTTVAVLDLSTALGQDLSASAKILGLALNDPVKGITSLRRAGISLDADQQKLIKRLAETGHVAEAQGLLLDEFSKRFGGSAAAAADTFGGALTQVKNAFGDLLEAKGGLNETKEALHSLAALLGDPATVEAANRLTSALITGFGKVVEIVSGLNILLSGANPFPFEAEIEQAQGLIKSIEKEIQEANFEFDPDRKFIRQLEGELDEAKRKLDEYKEKQRDALGLNPHAGGAAPATAPAASSSTSTPASAEFEKLRAHLEEQVALYGKVGEAAQIAYQIQSGALDELSTAEQQQVLALAKQYDGLVEAATALKEAEAAAKKLAQSFDSQVESYKEQIALVGEITELQKIRFAIEQGGLQGITEAQRAYLEGLAAQVDGIKAQADALKEHEALMERGKSLTESLATPQEQYNAALSEAIELWTQGVISQDTFNRSIDAAKGTLDKASESWSAFVDQAKRNTEGILADAIFDGFDNKSDNFLKSFGEMLRKMAAQAAAAKILDSIFGGGPDANSPGGQSTTPSWIKFIGSFFGGPRAAGGPTKAGQTYLVGEKGPELWKAPGNGYVTPLADAGAAPMGGINVQIINPPATPKVTQSRNQDGTTDLRIVFEKMADSWFGTGGADRTMRGRYGLAPALGGRR